jgi:peptidoglycan/LPS O-acetylase OafA/YrhL
VAGDTAWQWKYTLLVVMASLAAAAIVTYCFEKPISKILLKNKRLVRSETKFITEDTHEDIPV